GTFRPVHTWSRAPRPAISSLRVRRSRSHHHLRLRHRGPNRHLDNGDAQVLELAGYDSPLPYFESLRVQQQVWSQTVIWTSLLGTSLTAVGIILAVVQFGRGKEGRLSPYRGWFYWHHMVGLIFGVLMLTWVFSGLVSMNPWGFLESSGRSETSLVEGSPPQWKEGKSSLEAVRTQLVGSGVVSLTSAP